MTIEIREAKREQTNTLTALVGPSGSGKTYSAILMARGLVGQDGRIGLLDTENRRALHYADLAGGFDHADLRPPFAPERYIEAIRQFEKADYHVLIIDSVSHEWAGDGGVTDMADQIEIQTGKPGLHCWKKPKLQHKRFMNTLLQARMHLILCCRAKEKHVQRKGDGGRTEIVSEGLVPIAGNDLIYEMTASVMIDPETHGATPLKVPHELAAAFPEGERIGFETGQKLREWSERGIAIDPEHQRVCDAARTEARKGLDALTDWSKTLAAKDKKIVESIRSELGSIARAADEAKQMAETGPDGEKVVQLEKM